MYVFSYSYLLGAMIVLIFILGYFGTIIGLKFIEYIRVSKHIPDALRIFIISMSVPLIGYVALNILEFITKEPIIENMLKAYNL